MAIEAAAHPSVWGSTSTVSTCHSPCMSCMSKSGHGTSCIKGKHTVKQQAYPLVQHTPGQAGNCSPHSCTSRP